MRRVLWSLLLWAVAVIWVSGQDLPAPSPQGKEALNRLVDGCVKAGGLKAAKGSQGRERLLLANPAALRSEVTARRSELTTALRDALVTRWGTADEAEKLPLTALLQAVAEQTDDETTSAHAAYAVALVAERQQQYAAAQSGFEEAKRYFVRLRNPSWEAACLHHLGLVFAGRAEYAAALDSYRRALTIRRRLYGDAHVDVAITLNNLGSTHARLGQIAKALEHHQQALAVWRKVRDPDHPDVAYSLNNIGYVHQLNEDYDQAVKYYQQALALRRKAYGDVHPDIAISLNNLGSAFANQGRFARALECHRQALAVWRKLDGERHQQVGYSLNNLGYVHQARGEYGEAHARYQDALEWFRKAYGDDHAEVAVALNNLGALHADQGEFTRALRYHEQALILRKRYLGEDHPDVAASQMQIGFVLASQGDVTQALDRYRRAVAVWRKVHGENHPSVAYGLHNLGLLLAREGEWENALDLLRRSLGIRRQVLGETHPDVAMSWNAVGAVLAQGGDDTGALDHYQRALAVRRMVFGNRHPDVATSLNNIGLLYARRLDWPRALEVLTEAVLALRQGAGAPDKVGQLQAEDFMPLSMTVHTLYHRGRVLEASLGSAPGPDQLRECVRAYLLAAAVLDRVRQEVLETEASKVSLGGEHFDLFARLVGLYQRLFEKEKNAVDLKAAFTAAEQGTARVFLETLARSRAQVQAGISPELRAEEVELLARLRRLDERIAADQVKPPDRRSAERLGRLWEERRQAEERLDRRVARMERDFPHYTTLKYPRPCTVDQARSCLGAEEVALLYVPGTEASYVVLLEGRPAADDRSEGLAVYRLPAGNDIADKVESLTDCNTLDRPVRVRALGAVVYEQVLSPCAGRIRGKDLVIVPSGSLCYLPFELLVEGGKENGPGTLLVEAHAIRYAPSLTALVLGRRWERTRARPTRPLWGVGDPVYEPGDERVRGRVGLTVVGQESLAEYASRVRARPEFGLKYERLLYSGKELREIGTILNAAADDLHTGLEASEAEVKAASVRGLLADRRYLHFATHGLLGLDVGRQPSLVLSLVSGDAEDGFLQLDEVTDLRLNADLVVLSACQSGRGRLYHGEGVRSLARAFLYAGSRGVLCSLWSVSDPETARLMAELYRGLANGLSTTSALRAAQLRLHRDGVSPRHWAPFILVGE